MALYSYQALSKDGKRVKGQLDAPSTQAVKDQLIRQGLYPVRVEIDQKEKVGFTLSQLFERPVTPKEKIFFTKQLSVLLKSSVPLLQALELLSEQFEGRMRRIIVELKDGVKQGGSLAQGMSNYPRVFESIYVQLVRAGEASGKLEVILDRLTEYLERQLDLRKRIKSAMRQPLIQLVVIGLVTVFLLAFVVPRLTSMFSKYGGSLPLPTRILLAMSDTVKSYYLIIGILIVLIYVGYRYWKSTPDGKKYIDQFKLRLPLIGYFARTNAIVQFCGTLGMLLEAGVNLADSLDIVCSIVDNKVLDITLREARDKIIKEGKIAQYLKQTKIFPPMAIYLIKTGEESGRLDYMLQVVAQNYEADLRELTTTLSAQLEPLMLLFMAVVVGFIVLSIALPLSQMTELATKGM